MHVTKTPPHAHPQTHNRHACDIPESAKALTCTFHEASLPSCVRPLPQHRLSTCAHASPHSLVEESLDLWHEEIRRAKSNSQKNMLLHNDYVHTQEWHEEIRRPKNKMDGTWIFANSTCNFGCKSGTKTSEGPKSTQKKHRFKFLREGS